MPRVLDRADIQGNVIRSYRFPKARYLFLHIDSEKAGRRFVEAIRPRITTDEPWTVKSHSDGKAEKPKVTFNLAINFYGLIALGLPTSTLRDLPSEFIDGMAARAGILGDDFPGGDGLKKWDPVWRESDGACKVHMLVSLNAQMSPDGTAVPELAGATQWVIDQCAKGGMRILEGHGSGRAPYQDSSVLLVHQPDGTAVATPKEHFGFTDGFGDPAFEGQYPAEAEMEDAVGGGKIRPDQTWAPLATGEFLLGYPDEAQETPPAAMPFSLTRNGTFMAYRKLHQNVASFHECISKTARDYAATHRVSADQANEIVRAKMVGRWSNGVPLLAAPTWDAWQAFNAEEARARASGNPSAIGDIERRYVDFKYRSDSEGAKCPLTAHLRRANPRDMLDPAGPHSKSPNGSVLNNRRRILRRGLPYSPTPTPLALDDSTEQGIIFIALCASLFRQFEFVQQQWIQYGLDFRAGNDTCPLIGNHGKGARFVIPGDPAANTDPFVCDGLPQFVEMRGGDYFFVPSLTALRLIGMGIVDPT